VRGGALPALAIGGGSPVEAQGRAAGRRPSMAVVVA